MKLEKDPRSLLFPCPVVLVTCLDSNGKTNIITLAWAGIVSSNPPTLGLAIRPYRYSFKLVKATGEVVVNIPTTELLHEVDYCGNVSGKTVNKIEKTGLTLEPASKVQPPLIKECPINMECIVINRIPLGVHHLFLGRIVDLHIDQTVVTEKGDIDFSKISPIVYNHGEYWNLKEKIGNHGFSIKSDTE